MAVKHTKQSITEQTSPSIWKELAQIYEDFLITETITINLLKPTGYVMHQQFNIKQLTLCQHCIYVFCIYLRTNSDLCH
jgi:hypothetical protein